MWGRLVQLFTWGKCQLRCSSQFSSSHHSWLLTSLVTCRSAVRRKCHQLEMMGIKRGAGRLGGSQLQLPLNRVGGKNHSMITMYKLCATLLLAGAGQSASLHLPWTFYNLHLTLKVCIVYFQRWPAQSPSLRPRLSPGTEATAPGLTASSTWRSSATRCRSSTSARCPARCVSPTRCADTPTCTRPSTAPATTATTTRHQRDFQNCFSNHIFVRLE